MTPEKTKLSKSRQRDDWLLELVAQYDPDVIRYAVAAMMPESDDSDFSWAEFVRHTNDELIRV